MDKGNSERILKSTKILICSKYRDKNIM
jgi:hypothetical protein